MFDLAKFQELPPWAWALIVLSILPNLWCIWHAYTHDFPTVQEKLIWMCGGVFIPVLGGLTYLIFGWRRSAKPGAACKASTEKSTQD